MTDACFGMSVGTFPDAERAGVGTFPDAERAGLSECPLGGAAILTYSSFQTSDTFENQLLYQFQYLLYFHMICKYISMNLSLMFP